VPIASAGILASLIVVLVAAKAGGAVFKLLGQPSVVGELLAGVVAGPAALGWFQVSSTLDTVAAIGAIVLLFEVGLQTKASDLFRVGRTAVFVALLGVAVPFCAGYGFGAALGIATPEALFIGTALVATSVGITARVLTERGLISTRAARIILAAAVFDDILGIVVLSVVVGAARGGFDPIHLALVLTQVAAFVGFELLIAPRLARRHGHRLGRLRGRYTLLAVALAVMLTLAAIADLVGLAGIVGAFFAGMMFAETPSREQLERDIRPLYVWLVPYFFAVTGSRIDLGVLARPEVLWPGLLLAGIAVVTKVAGAGAGALGDGWRQALAVGVGMVPRGEVGLIVASVGLAAGIVTAPVYGMVLLVVVATTVIAPPLLPWAFALAARDGA
jgi:Kef-type K+ transport system membrane component KefB